MLRREIVRWSAWSIPFVLCNVGAVQAQCLDWRPGFSSPGGGVDQAARAEIQFDDGSGPALYVGGSFSQAGGILARHIANWNGSSWSSPGSGTDADVAALAVFDDGQGSALYAAGAFSLAGGQPASHV